MTPGSASRPPSIESLIAKFVRSVIAQGEQINSPQGDVKLGNRCARAYFSAWRTLLVAYGDEGREALSALFTHPEVRVRTIAASLLLKYCTDRALAVLKAAAADGDVASIYAIKAWERGEWALDTLT